VPTDTRVCIESRGRTVRVNAPFGHAINETLGRLLSALVGQQTGSSVGMSVDPYRISFEVPQGVSAGVFRDLLASTEPAHLESYLELALKGSETLKFRLVQVAAKFGALKRYQGQNRYGADRLLAALEDTPAYDEAIREIFHGDLAIEGAADVLRRIQSDEIELRIVGDETPLGRSSQSTGQELLVPEKADASVIQAIKSRIQNAVCCCVVCTAKRGTIRPRSGGFASNPNVRSVGRRGLPR